MVGLAHESNLVETHEIKFRGFLINIYWSKQNHFSKITRWIFKGGGGEGYSGPLSKMLGAATPSPRFLRHCLGFVRLSDL